MHKRLSRSLGRRVFAPRILPYDPPLEALRWPDRLISVDSAWKDNAPVLSDLLQHFDVGRESCLEFGVEFGYSTVALSNFFAEVIGVDLFAGDRHTVHKGDHYAQTAERLAVYPNITLVRSDYRDWIAHDDRQYDLIHVDIVHTYRDTYQCGLWSARHAKCVLFHDTLSFLDVQQAAIDVARKTRRRVYNYSAGHGLGIVVQGTL